MAVACTFNLAFGREVMVRRNGNVIFYQLRMLHDSLHMISRLTISRDPFVVSRRLNMPNIRMTTTPA
jgi:hypothetical protein